MQHKPRRSVLPSASWIPLTPSKGVRLSRISPTPFEGVKSPQCLYRRCDAVLLLLSTLTPSKGVGLSCIFPTPSEGVK